MNYDLALIYLGRAHEMMPEDEELSALTRAVESVKAWDFIPQGGEGNGEAKSEADHVL